MIDLNQNDNLTVSVLYKDGTGSIDIDLESEFGTGINSVNYGSSSKGEWTWGIAEETARHFIEVETNSYRGKYTILFSLSGDNLWFRDQPVTINDTNKYFSMLEDTIDVSHVNLYDIFYDPDSSLTFGSTSHPAGYGTNIDCAILPNATVKFMPYVDFTGFELANFYGTDGDEPAYLHCCRHQCLCEEAGKEPTEVFTGG